MDLTLSQTWPALLTGAGVVALGFILGVFANWFEKPEWLTNLRLISVTLVTAIALVLVQLVATQYAPSPDSPKADASECLNTYRGSGSPTVVNSGGNVRSTEIDNGIQVTFADLTWAGVALSVPGYTCDYRLELDARLVDIRPDVSGAGLGYGIGVCDLWDGRQPSGFIVQYATYNNSGTVETNVGRFSMPLVNDGIRVPVSVVDDQVHHWIMTLRDNKVSFSIDFGPEFGPFPVTQTPTGENYEKTLPPDCRDAGAFLRVLGTTAEFTNIRIQGTG